MNCSMVFLVLGVVLCLALTENSAGEDEYKNNGVILRQKRSPEPRGGGGHGGFGGGGRGGFGGGFGGGRGFGGFGGGRGFGGGGFGVGAFGGRGFGGFRGGGIGFFPALFVRRPRPYYYYY